ncbi:MAG: glycoside hydrolase family 57 protein [Paludibacteraceae bacterium]|nr:glycoside hydrolase family 57 protein [Paludibacteraceae bacterium]
MKNICFCFQMHVPYRMKRYRFFDIGQDHYYYDDMATEEYLTWLVETSYLPLMRTIQEMIKLSKGRFHCGISVTGATLELFEQYCPEMIDQLKELCATKSVELLATPFAYSLAGEFDERELENQLEQTSNITNELFGVRPTVVWNTELLYTDELAALLHKAGYKGIMTEGAKHILSWKSANYVYQSAGDPKMKVLARNAALSDELSFHFSDPGWYNYPMDAEKYANQLNALPEGENLINIWLGAETFGVRQQAGSGIFDFLRALPYYALEREMGFVTPSEAIRKAAATTDVISSPYALTWAGEAKDLSIFAGNDLQQEAIQKLYAVAERVKMCQDKRLKSDWARLQDANYLHQMNHIDQGLTQYESAYDAFINYMNILADFLQLVDEQYPTTIENEELNSLLKTINNQEKEIAQLQGEVRKLKAKKK